MFEFLEEFAGAKLIAEGNLKVFQRQHPFYNEMDLISSQRRTLIGTGHGEVPGKTAGLMIKKGWVDVTHGRFGKELDMTAKGRKVWNQYQDDWDDFVG